MYLNSRQATSSNKLAKQLHKNNTLGIIPTVKRVKPELNESNSFDLLER